MLSNGRGSHILGMCYKLWPSPQWTVVSIQIIFWEIDDVFLGPAYENTSSNVIVDRGGTTYLYQAVFRLEDDDKLDDSVACIRCLG